MMPALSLSQALCAAYRLTQSVTLEPSKSSKVQMAVTVGLRQEYDCETCDDGLKEERGYCPYQQVQRAGQVPQLIDSTGDDSHDFIQACPKGIVIRNPLLSATIDTFHEAQNTGGAAAYFGAPLCTRPRRLRTTYSVLVAAESRLQAYVSKARRQMDGG